ncbi:MAG: Rrf2 family transcriptional regulator [Acidobacteriota bacterium]
MRLSTRPRYALRLMIEVARTAGTEETMSLATVAEQTHLSRGYLEQLTVALRAHRLLRGVCGKGGGFSLARSPEEITVRDVIESVLGPINIVECVENPSICAKSARCECRVVYLLINKRITEALDEFTLADLLDVERVRCALAGSRIDQPGTARKPGRAGAGRNVQGKGKQSSAGVAHTDDGGCPGGWHYDRTEDR